MATANLEDVKKRYKSVVTSLEKSLECPVCLETVKTPFKVCVKGHSACLECITKLEKCPLCQESYILENLVCLKNVLEALPHLCRYSGEGCEEVVELGNEHERFCGYRPIVCREFGCSDKMPLVQILNHYKNQHPRTLIYDKERLDDSSLKTPAANYFKYEPVSLFDNLFWIVKMYDTREKQFKIYFQATPNGKLEHDYYVRVTFEKDKFIYTYTIKATILSSCEEKFERKQLNLNEETVLLPEQYCMKIPQSELSRFKIVGNLGNLKYKYWFFRE